MLKTFFQAIFTVLFFSACAALLLAAFKHDQDKKVFVECASCKSDLPWCESYWEDKGLCKYAKKGE